MLAVREGIVISGIGAFFTFEGRKGLLAATLVVAVVLVCLGTFIAWRRRLLLKVFHGSEIAGTARGPVEFARVGTGPVILQLHGGASGYDQALSLSWDLDRAGFAVLTPSRPGYLRTPLATGATPEQAADAMASLLDGLGLEQVGVIGTSGGGPTALQFALRHPKRVWGLILQSAISQRFIEPRRSTHSLIGRVIFSTSGKWLADFGACAAFLVARYWPGLLIRTLFNASEDLAREKARQRRRYVQQHPEQMTFLRRLAACGMPLSVRQAGLWNDLHQYAQLLVYPLEQIICPTLVLHGRADGNVPFAHAEFVARTVPKVELLVLEDCGHLIWVGPGATQAREKVMTFLTQHAPLATANLQPRA
jgi:pimeloyl-ACP methyl ester carboxylesterase